MQLKKISIENFRSYLAKVDIDVSDFTAFIGRNEHGKSSILEALEIFFNNETVKIDNDDPCVRGTSTEITISCTFSNFSESIVIDASYPTTLANEYLLNREGNIEIVKKYDCSKSKIAPDIYVKAHHPSEESARDLLLLKQTDLKKRAKNLNIDLTNIDERSNAALRKAIRESIGTPNLEDILIPLNKEGAKEAWEQIQKYMPTFALFRSDRSSNEDDNEVADPMKLAIKEAIKVAETQLDDIKETVRRYAMEVAERTISKLSEMDPDIANSLELEFKAEPVRRQDILDTAHKNIRCASGSLV